MNGVYYEGLVMDAVNIQPEQEFKISIGAVYNIGRSAFDGNLRIALVGKNGTIKNIYPRKSLLSIRQTLTIVKQTVSVK